MNVAWVSLGFGRIGSRVAGSRIGDRILDRPYDLKEIPESARHGAMPLTMDELLATSDVLSIHVDGRASNHNLSGTDELNRLPGLCCR